MKRSLTQKLGLLGVVSFLSYTAAVVFAPLTYPGYNWMAQAVLDTENSSQIIQLLSKLAHEETCCVVVVTHDLEVAKAADVVFRMDSGRIKEDAV